METQQQFVMGLKRKLGGGSGPPPVRPIGYLLVLGSRGRSVGVSGPPSRQTYCVFTCSGIQGGRVGDPEARPV